MPVAYTVEQHEGYALVRVANDPTLDEFLLFVEKVGRQSRDWSTRQVLVDLRSVRSLRNFTEHYAIGEAVGRHLLHLRKLASLVPADRVTRASEKTARLAGAHLSVFTDEGEAIAWLRNEALTRLAVDVSRSIIGGDGRG